MRLLPTLFALVLSGCATQPGVTLSPLPAWRAPIAAETTFLSTRVAALARNAVPGAFVSHADDRYTLISHRWLEEYLSWTWHASKAAGIRYTPESFDCDDFSRIFETLATLAAAKAGVHAAPTLARIVVDLDGRTRHALLGVATDAGLFVVEPQPDAGPFRIVPLALYKQPIRSIIFGDFNPN